MMTDTMTLTEARLQSIARADSSAEAVLDALQSDDLWERDEDHSMDELYRYRMLYNALLVNTGAYPCVKSRRHDDGELCLGGAWFIVTMELPTGQVLNHYKDENWDLFQCPEAQVAPVYDGHTPAEAADHMEAACTL